MSKCVFCGEPLSEKPTVTLTAKGCRGIVDASLKRGVEIDVRPGETVHTECRRVHCNPNEISSFNRKRAAERSNESDLNRTLRSETPSFSYKDNCLFCTQPDRYSGKKKDHVLIPVRTLDFDKSVLKHCDERNDIWGENVRGRVMFAQDLHASDACYHQLCSANFRTKKGVPQIFAQDEEVLSKKPRVGRPENSVRAEAFAKVSEYLKLNDEEQISINDLIEKMGNFLQGTGLQPYGFTFMKEKLQENFGDEIIITEINGCPNIVTFRSTASSILNAFYRQPKSEDLEAEKMRLIEAASNLIRTDIKSVVQDKAIYPTSLSVSSVEDCTAFIPKSLQLLLNVILVGKDKDLKLCSLGQAIMQAARPRILIAPLQLGLAVQMHHQFSSRFLNDTLNAHGYCSSYSEVQRYERCAAVSRGLDISEFFPGKWIQYVADNVDHDIRTLDGRGTFHGMGMIGAVCPKTDVASIIKRISVTGDDISSVGHINIKPFIPTGDELRDLRYECLSPQCRQGSLVDLLWKTSLTLQPLRPGWSGYMQLISNGCHPGPSSVMFLPMIDMNPSDMTCVNSTLHFVSEHAQRHGVTPVVTFDQPLWWKAMTIIHAAAENSPLHSVLPRLGGFHTLMSFLGSIGHLMSGTGLQEVLEVIFAGNSVPHIISGKAYSRAIRGHFLIDGVVHTLLLSKLYETKLGLPTPDEEDWKLDSAPEELQTLAKLYASLMSGDVQMEDIVSDETLCALQSNVKSLAEDLETKSPTSKLWLMYMTMVDIARDFLRSERTGDWLLHLSTMQEMLPFMAAAGHNLYTKSLRIYLQMMEKLQETHQSVYDMFMQGHHVIRRSDRFWAGLSPDLCIEQCLMRSLKTSGGLTRGRGMSDTQRVVWCLSQPACAEMSMAMQELTCVRYATSEQHKDLSDARLKRDAEDSQKVYCFLEWRSPFETGDMLMNVVSGISAGAKVDVHRAKEIGKAILNKMTGNSVIQHSMKKKDQAITFDSNATVKIGDDMVHIDPQLLFQRLIIIGTQTNDLENALAYELCSFPPSLFAGKDMLLEANKSQLADAIRSAVPFNPPPAESFIYILDGGSLVHRIPWAIGDTYGKILEDYCNYVTKHYKKAVIVFDGYDDGPSTKDATHKRRVGNEGRKVVFNAAMKLQLKKKEFLSNKENKQRIIGLLGEKLSESGCDVLHAPGDADVLIVETAVGLARTRDVVLVGEDTDLLVLLLHHAQTIKHDIFFRPEPKKGTPVKCFSIKAARSALGKVVCSNILFVHSFLGCDTTSRIFGIGKGSSLKHLNENQVFCEQGRIFQNPKSSKESVVRAGEKAMVSLFKGRDAEDLDKLRYQRFKELMITSKKAVQPNMLPPTSAAMQQHSLRVYHQIQMWKGNKLDAQKWGWKIQDGRMVPVATDKEPAPQALLHRVRCTCRTGCGTRRCGCVSSGLECSTACSGCRGICENMKEVDDTDD